MFHRRLIAAATVIAASVLMPLGTSTATAHADDCTGSWSIGVGGFSVSIFNGTGEDSRYLGVDQPVGYNSLVPMEGFNEVTRLFWQHRGACPDDHVTLIGHSEGAGIVHAWVTANQDVDNANAVLLSDPKRAAGPGTAGFANNPLSVFIGYPMAGVDADFGSFPVLSVCNHDDVVCNEGAGWYGYATGAHGRYDYNAADYDDWASGVIFQ